MPLNELVSPDVKSFFPILSPISTGWDASISTTVTGGPFFEEFNYKCLFAQLSLFTLSGLFTSIDDSWSTSSYAISRSSTTMRCPLPSITNTTTLKFSFFPDLTAYGNVSFSPKSIGPFLYRFYGTFISFLLFPSASRTIVDNSE